ncbi:IclR family transcriptional regulator [Blastococcus saxobsidens]|uniref:Glycerol operon regulatory protein n=1 Tax=Blastococcus saxobsidens TaxID=138336 RepID=A0A4Q7Y2K9_9ACTN|nr:IclR family transcriptional regulator [Blastococcus saxobsidens]RZU31052.1 IclR family transcriptional regulator [Blastococcus saxobsidens]
MGVEENRAAERAPAALVQSVDRALAVLEILGSRGEAGVTEIAAELGVHKSTAFRLVAVLESREFVEQLAERGKYRLGFGIVRLAGVTAAQLDLTREGRRTCEELAVDLGETVNIAILDGDRVVNISQARGSGAITSYNWVGQATPLHATSSGKVLLAFAPEPLRKKLLGGDLPRFTDATLTTPEALERELAETRRRGWAATAEEYEMGLNAVAAPVRDAESRVVAAVSASGPAFRLTRESFDVVSSQVVAAADALSRRLGFFPR